MKTPMLAALAVAALTAPLSAQTVPAADPGAADGAYLKYITMDSVGEIQLCRLALQKSQDSEVKAFAQKMIDDHTASIAKASTLAKTMTVADFKVVPSEDAQVEYTHLASYSGHAFDEAFMKHNVEDHQNDIDVTRHGMEIAKNADVKSFEASLLPQLEDHLQQAERATDSVAAKRD